MEVAFCFYMAYFTMSLPISYLLNRIQYKKTLMLGISMILLGSIIFIIAMPTLKFETLLLALFIFAIGVVTLDVTTNPFMAIIGPTTTAPARLNLGHSFTLLSTIIIPIIIATSLSSHLSRIYIIIAMITLSALIFISMLDFSHIKMPEISRINQKNNMLRQASFLFGLLAIFCYMGAEASTAGLLINYLHLPQVMGFTLEKAAKYLSFFWGGIMLGRLVGSYIMTKINPAKLLMFAALSGIILIMITITSRGKIAMWSFLALGLSDSIMFPTIFGLLTGKLSHQYLKNKASGFFATAMVGGAFISLFQGKLADMIGLQHAFAGLIVCYLIIFYYAYRRINYSHL
ncbi:MAG: MFS transporter [Pseudomonadota bacterium]